MLQSRQQYEQEQANHVNSSNPSKPEAQIEVAPTRKNSGKNLLRIARQASDSAFRSVGLNRKSSKKDVQAASALQAKEAELNFSHEANSHSRFQNQPSGMRTVTIRLVSRISSDIVCNTNTFCSLLSVLRRRQ